MMGFVEDNYFPSREIRPYVTRGAEIGQYYVFNHYIDLKENKIYFTDLERIKSYPARFK